MKLNLEIYYILHFNLGGKLVMKVSIAQMDMKFADPEFNFKHAEELIRKAALEKPDVIVLPETWNTGFFPDKNLASLSDQNGEKTKELCGGLAKELNVNIVAGSVSNVKNGKVYNTAFIFNRSGNCIAEYDKIHAFTPMKEDVAYQKGDHLALFELDGHRCGMIICYDIRFPELTRALAVKGIDILFISAQWPAVRRTHWQILTKARAIENQVFLAACNSCGKAGETVYGGTSCLLNPWGEVIQEAGPSEEIISGDFDFEILKGIRSSINVYVDRRPDLYAKF
jgi:omega-amidase